MLLMLLMAFDYYAITPCHICHYALMLFFRYDFSTLDAALRY